MLRTQLRFNFMPPIHLRGQWVVDEIDKTTKAHIRTFNFPEKERFDSALRKAQRFNVRYGNDKLWRVTGKRLEDTPNWPRGNRVGEWEYEAHSTYRDGSKLKQLGHTDRQTFASAGYWVWRQNVQFDSPDRNPRTRYVLTGREWIDEKQV